MKEFLKSKKGIISIVVLALLILLAIVLLVSCPKKEDNVDNDVKIETDKDAGKDKTDAEKDSEREEINDAGMSAPQENDSTDNQNSTDFSENSKNEPGNETDSKDNSNENDSSEDVKWGTIF